MIRMELNCAFILASGSPRRRLLLEQIGLPFAIAVSDVEEVIPPALAPEEVVCRLALEKAGAVARNNPDALVLGADTIVVLDDMILGKPSTEEEAAEMLRRLAGRTHTVYTGISLLHPASGRSINEAEATRVTFSPMDEREIASYVATGSPMDKAGAYGIQDDRGALFISRIDGDYYNVVGLPLFRLYKVLKTHFPDLISF